MGLVEFELRSVDPLLRAGPGVLPDAPGVSFIPSGTLDCRQSHDLFLGDDAATTEASRLFAEAAARAHGQPVGDLAFHDVFVAGTRGLLVDRTNRIVWVGESIGWSRELARIDIEEHLAGRVADDGTVVLDDRLFTLSKAERAGDHDWPERWFNDARLDLAPQSLAHLHLLALPGIAIYGHWLVDVLPRLARIASGEVPEAPLYTPFVPQWSRRLARRIGVDLSGPGLGRMGALTHADRVDVQTLIKRQRVLDRVRSVAAWDRLAAALDRRRPARGPEVDGDRLYVSRAKWRSGRALANHAEIEEHMAARGFTVVHPEELSLAAQRAVFSRARRVVGEDGSGLHNVIFAGADLHLTVIDLDRTNVFHASIANAKRQHLTHLASDPSPEGWRLPVSRLDEHLDRHETDVRR
jgi:hypothetical protein